MKKIKNLTILTIAIIVVVAGVGFSSPNLPTSITENPKYHSMVSVYKNGELIERSHNVLTDEGKEFIEAELGTSPSTNVVDTMVLGNTTAPVAGDSTHPGEITDCGLSSGSITWSSAGTGNMTASYEWTSTCSVIVNTTGLECSACGAGTDYFAGNSFTDANMEPDDKLNVTWVAYWS